MTYYIFIFALNFMVSAFVDYLAANSISFLRSATVSLLVTVSTLIVKNLIERKKTEKKEVTND